jgi:hypothetical protein
VTRRTLIATTGPAYPPPMSSTGRAGTGRLAPRTAVSAGDSVPRPVTVAAEAGFPVWDCSRMIARRHGAPARAAASSGSSTRTPMVPASFRKSLTGAAAGAPRRAGARSLLGHQASGSRLRHDPGGASFAGAARSVEAGRPRRVVRHQQQLERRGSGGRVARLVDAAHAKALPRLRVYKLWPVWVRHETIPATAPPTYLYDRVTAGLHRAERRQRLHVGIRPAPLVPAGDLRPLVPRLGDVARAPRADLAGW